MMEIGSAMQQGPFHEPEVPAENLSLPKPNAVSEQDFRRLRRSLLSGSQWQFSLIDCPLKEDQDRWKQRINEEIGESGLRFGELLLSEKITDVPALLHKMKELSEVYDLVHVVNGDEWFDGQNRWEHLNLHRENFARECRSGWLLWGGEALIQSCANQAYDLWAWRQGVYQLGPIG